jgi:hypothetical protein
MNYTDAQSRRQSLRDGQTARAKLVPGQEIDKAAFKAEALRSGVPPRYAGITRGDFLGKDDYETLGKLIDDMASPDTGADGIVLIGPNVRILGNIAGAAYSGAMARNLAAKWYTFPEYVDQLSQKISFDKQNEWEVGEMRDWLTELDSAKNCYDLVVVHGVTAQLMISFVGAELYKLLSSRSTRGLYTIITQKSGQSETMWDNAPAIVHLLEEEFTLYEVGGHRAGK